MCPSGCLHLAWLESNLNRVARGYVFRPYVTLRASRQGVSSISSVCRSSSRAFVVRRFLHGVGSAAPGSSGALLDLGGDSPCVDPCDLLRRVQCAFSSHLDVIVCWLRSSRSSFVRDVDPSVVSLLRNAERFASLHGLLLCDVDPSALERHVMGASSLRDLFSPAFIEEQKSHLYRHQHLPLLRHPRADASVPPEDSVCAFEGEGEMADFASPDSMNYKRQVLIERQSFAEALETARVEASSLMELEKPSELPALSHTCEQWIYDIAEFIKHDRLNNPESVLPSSLDENTLARATVNIALQLMCFPAYALDSRGQRGGLMRRRPQQTAGNQVLLAHAAIRLGDEVGRIYARKLGEARNAASKTVTKLPTSVDLFADPPSPSHLHSGGSVVPTVSSALRGVSSLFDIPKIVSGGLGALTVSAFSVASKARVMSNSASGVVEPTPQFHSDGTLSDDQRQWNSKQSAAVGGYLLHALVQSCYVQVDLTTALRQTNSFAELDPSLFLPDMGVSGVPGVPGVSGLPGEPGASEVPGDRNAHSEKSGRHSASAAKRHKWLSKAVSRIKQSRFDAGKVEIAAFGHKVHRHGVKVYGVLEMKECCMIHLRDAVARGLVSLSCLPMVCEPKPWTSISSGGLALLKHYFIRTQHRPTFDVRVYDLSRVLEVVSSFGRVPWRINVGVLRMLQSLWTTDAVLPVRSFLPDKSLVELDPSLVGNSMARANALSECSLFERRLRVADDFSCEPRIYFPQNIDFRGRMYPLSPHLNHMADDVCRSLLKFSEKRALGDRGFFWLKVHLSNLYGLDKVPFCERVEWVESNVALIRQLVHSPLSEVSQSFWRRAENPFQFYAAAVELVGALDSGNPSSYMSDLPIHQDGSCNGLQHYAALGRDLKGGAAVNLLPSDRPQDVYQQVLLEVITKVRGDVHCGSAVSAGDPLPQRARLSRLCLEHGLLRRKVVKQTVMTICYGVTRTGAVSQIENRLKEVASLDSLGASTLRQLASYIAVKVLGSIKSVFAEAMSIKAWLDDISAAHNRLNVPVTWISPIGLPCEQPYCKAVTKVVRTPIQAINVSEQAPSVVDKRRQKLAFPPNFVHSLDASHLMLTAERMFSLGLSFAAVHDSYWTHACHVDVMNREIREQFVRMYSEPILENLYASCTKRLRGEVLISPPPSRGHLDLSSVRDSLYFFH